MGKVAQGDFGKIVLDDVTRWSVSRCEVKVGASLVASARFFFKVMQDQFLGDSDFPCLILGFRSDATNSGIWRNKSLCACEVDAAWCDRLSYARDGDGMGFETLKRICDVLPVGAKSGRACVAMLEKHLASIECPSWRTHLDAKEELKGYYFYMYTSDTGWTQFG